MRLSKLNLKAYGNFFQTSFDLTHAKTGADLHIFFGYNEAGKTTALSAIEQGLYGFNDTDRLCYRFPASELRVGLDLEHHDHVFSFFRRPGRNNTIVDDKDNIIPDGQHLLAEMVGVDRTTFQHIFGLSHNTLRRGGEDILNTKDDAGSLIFGAMQGLDSLGTTLRELENKASSIFAPRAKVKPLNKLILRYATDKLTFHKNPHTVAKWQELIDLQVEEESKLNQDDENIAKLRDYIHRLKSLHQSRQKITTLSKLKEETVQLSALPDLPANFWDAWQLAEKNCDEHEHQVSLRQNVGRDLKQEYQSIVIERVGRSNTFIRLENLMRKVGDQHETLLRLNTQTLAAKQELNRISQTINETFGLQLRITSDIPDHTRLQKWLKSAHSTQNLEGQNSILDKNILNHQTDLTNVEKQLARISLRNDATELDLALKESWRLADAGQRIRAHQKEHQRLSLRVREISKDLGYRPNAVSAIEEASIWHEKQIHNIKYRLTAVIIQFAALLNREINPQSSSVDARQDRALLSRYQALRDLAIKVARNQNSNEKKYYQLLAAQKKSQTDLLKVSKNRNAVRKKIRVEEEKLRRQIAAFPCLATSTPMTIALIQELSRWLMIWLDGKNKVQALAKQTESLCKDKDILQNLVYGEKKLQPSPISDREVMRKAGTLIKNHQQNNEKQQQKINLQQQIIKNNKTLQETKKHLSKAILTRRGLLDILKVKKTSEVAARKTQLKRRYELQMAIKDLEEDLRINKTSEQALKKLQTDLKGVSILTYANDLQRQLDDKVLDRDKTLRREEQLNLKIKNIAQDTSREDLSFRLEQDKADIVENAEGYIRYQAAALTLRFIIEHQSKSLQAPLLAEVSRLFARLTAGRFRGISCSSPGNKNLRLLVELANGKQRNVDTLSDGTRDQMYLALRLGVFHHLRQQKANLPPIIGDDILVNFDNRREDATLATLQEISHTKQVILFTHHGHLVDSALRLFSKDGFRLHTLPVLQEV